MFSTWAEVILHLAGGPKGDDRAAQNLVRAAEEHHIRHLVHISVIGADRMPIGYFRAKAGAERAITESTVPSTILRAAQFHTLILKVAQQMAKLPVIPAPRGLRAEPVDPGEVADRLLELTFDKPAGLVEDLAGPHVHAMTDLVRSYLAARGKRRAALPIRIPGAVGRAYRAGQNLSVAADTGSLGWEQFLAQHLQTGPDVVQIDR